MRGTKDEKIKRYEDAMKLQMFMINEYGPTKLLFKVCDGDHEYKVKISITDTIDCSCGGSKERCKHAIFCLVKVYKVPYTSDLLFIEKYTDSQINYILEGRYSNRSSDGNKKHNFLKRKDEKNKTVGTLKKISREIDASDTCPICYDDLGDKQSLSTCKCCSNHYHTACIITWSKHQMTIHHNKPIKCPTCRHEWNDTALSTIRSLEEDMERHNRREFVHNGIMCSVCSRKDVVGSIYMNVHSNHKVVCETCFINRYLHRDSSSIVVKHKHTDGWQPHNSALSMPRFLCNALNSVGTDSSNSLQIIGFDISSVLCAVCKKKGNDIKKLPCDHKICASCVEHTFSSSKNHLYKCPLDNQNVFNGFLSYFNKHYKTENEGAIVKSKITHLSNITMNKVQTKRNTSVSHTSTVNNTRGLSRLPSIMSNKHNTVYLPSLIVKPIYNI